MKKIILAIGISSILICSSIVAAEEPVTIPVTEEEKVDAGMGMFPNMDEVAGSNLEKQRDEYLNKRKRRLGFNSKGSYLGWASATISGSPKNLDFGQKRIVAFEKAFTDAKGEFVQAKKMQTSVKLSRTLFHDDNEAKKNIVKSGSLEIIGKKMMSLAGAKLDQALLDLGVDPKTLEGSTIEQKRKKAIDAFNKEINIEAISNVSGIRILATFEDTQGVGVLIVQTPKYAEIARAIASRQIVPFESENDPIDTISSQINEKFQDKNLLIPQYGIRIMNDNAGNRVLISFGQWSPKITKGDSRMKINMAIKAAEQIAYNQALSYMTQFINTTMAVSDKSKIEGSDTMSDLIHTDGSIEKDQEVSKVGATLDRFIKETSSANIEGVSPIKSWRTNHPDTGHPIVGRILMWSPVTQEYARQKPKLKQTSSVAQSKKKERVMQNKVYKSKDLGDNDF